ncbi:hypothetical protein HHK36_005507 [Tetracentron sinense]|uniref:EF-hand domain-containing protein n=1 Tax=Tetracentron sinense TaxID=13715 RepID=A0A834ZUA9_TETSI|nr:hypothetical protein HHK36_005507 [Tetracentron sinense]
METKHHQNHTFLFFHGLMIQRLTSFYESGEASMSSPSSNPFQTLLFNSPLIPKYIPIHFSLENKSQEFPMAEQKTVDFEDFLPTMADKLGGEGLIGELCNGFQLLMDGDKGLITFESLKRNAVLLGLQDLRDDELLSMLREGDMDGDGALNQMEFCVLMFRLSPDLMEESQSCLEEALQQELKD